MVGGINITTAEIPMTGGKERHTLIKVGHEFFRVDPYFLSVR
jgi:hypothetical protein